MMTKLISILFLILLLFSCKNDKKIQSNLLHKIDSLEVVLNKTYKPGFGEIMSSIQSHHLKLWLSGINSNWKLAAFEIHELNELMEDITKYQGKRDESKSLEMMFPSIKAIKNSVDIKSVDKFKKDFVVLTKTCNDCHIKTEYDYINIIVPDNNYFSNQKF